MTDHVYADRVAQVIVLLRQGPHTVMELIADMGLPPGASTRNAMGKLLRSLQAHGLVRIVGTRAPQYKPGHGGGRGWLWAWVAG